MLHLLTTQMHEFAFDRLQFTFLFSYNIFEHFVLMNHFLALSYRLFLADEERIEFGFNIRQLFSVMCLFLHHRLLKVIFVWGLLFLFEVPKRISSLLISGPTCQKVIFRERIIKVVFRCSFLWRSIKGRFWPLLDKSYFCLLSWIVHYIIVDANHIRHFLLQTVAFFYSFLVFQAVLIAFFF